MGHTYRPRPSPLAGGARDLPPPVAALVAPYLEGADGDAWRATALDVLQHDVGFDDACFVPFSEAFFARAPDYLVRFVNDPAYVADLRRAVEVGNRAGSYVDTDVYTARERDRLPLFRDLLRPAGVASQLVALVRGAGRESGVVHLSRHAAARAFTSAELERVRALMPIVGLLHAALCPAPGVDSAAARALSQKLSPRQIDIALLVAEGCQNVQVAARLGLSERTVRNQVSEIFARLGVFSRAELALSCERAGLLLAPSSHTSGHAALVRSVARVMSADVV